MTRRNTPHGFVHPQTIERNILGPLLKPIFYGVFTLLWLSGTVWFCLPAAHPAQPMWLKIHGATAMAFLIIFGAILFQHVPRGWRKMTQRSSGASLLAVCGVLILTGWGLYYIGDEQLRYATHWIHSVLGLILPLIILIHIWLARR